MSHSFAAAIRNPVLHTWLRNHVHLHGSGRINLIRPLRTIVSTSEAVLLLQWNRSLRLA
jgi:hypothetical protein